MSIKYTSVSTLYQDFCSIDPYDYHRLMRYFEEHEPAIENLPIEELLPILFDYGNAVYETGGTRQYLEYAQEILELSIIHNIQFHRGVDLYSQTLYQKADVHYRMGDDAQAIQVLEQLIKIDSSDARYLRLLRRSLTAKRPKWLQRCYAAGILLYFVSVLFIIANILLVLPWAELSIIDYLRGGSFALGLLIMTGGFLWHRVQIQRRVHRILQAAKRKRVA